MSLVDDYYEQCEKCGELCFYGQCEYCEEEERKKAPKKPNDFRKQDGKRRKKTHPKGANKQHG